MAQIIKNESSPFLGFKKVFKPYQESIDRKISEFLNKTGNSSKLAQACSYSLTTGGKRYRPALVLMVANALGNKMDVSEAALSIELFHTSSLIADDLPLMDNDDERRNQPSVHKAFGESVALLASYALIAAGYECIARNVNVLAHGGTKNAGRIGTLALENAAYNTGIAGATGGQFLDLFPPDSSLVTVQETLRKKTVSLFEVSMVFGWLFGGGDVEKLDLVKKAAYHFGMAFQIADDINDLVSDAKGDRQMNLAAVVGIEKAKQQLEEELSQFLENLKNLSINNEEFNEIAISLRFLS